MHCKFISAFVAFALASSAFAAPISLTQRSSDDIVARDRIIFPRAVTATFTFSNDLASPSIPAALPSTASAKDQKKNAAKITKAQAKLDEVLPKQQAAQARAQILLDAAQSDLTLPATMNIDLVNDFHSSRSDNILHATFKFTAPGKCSTGCTGHAYQATQPTVGKIFKDGVDGPIFQRDFDDFEDLLARDELFTRAVTPAFTFTGDLATPSKANKVAAAQAKQAAASGVVQTVLNAAQATLGLPDALPVTVTNNFHTSKDPISHVTFRITAPGDCAGGCTGHAYAAGSTPVGKVFSDTTRAQLF